MEQLSKTPREGFMRELKEELMDMTAAFACGGLMQEVAPIDVKCEVDAGWAREARYQMIQAIESLVFTETDYNAINHRAYSAKQRQFDAAEEHAELKRCGRLEPEETEKDFDIPL